RAARPRRDQPVAHRAFPAARHRLGLPVRHRLFPEPVAAGAVSRDPEPRRPMSAIGGAEGALAFIAVLAALVALFAFGLRLRLPSAGPRRWPAQGALAGAAGLAALLANVALYRHDAHLDLTRE